MKIPVILILLSLLGAQPTMGQAVFVLPGGPSNNGNLLVDYVWESQVAHSDLAPVSCDTPQAASISQCYFEYEVDQAIVDAGATHLAVRVKTKAWVKAGSNTGVMNYALIYGKYHSPDPADVMNHFFHCEVWGGGADYQKESRRVNFTTAYLPIVDGKVRIDIGKEVIGPRGSLEIGIYAEGYLAPFPAIGGS